MTLRAAVAWLDEVLEPHKFDDVANNGLQLDRRGRDIERVAFGVDASSAFVDECVRAGAQLAVVHHGISWGGGIKRLAGGVYEVVKKAMDADLAIYASHLPLDAHPEYGNNAGIVRKLELERVSKAFSYHGNIIGMTGFASRGGEFEIGRAKVSLTAGEKVGVCSGGAGSFAEEAKELGCSVYVTGEADWGETVAARNAGAKMVCAGHYETETFGVASLCAAMQAATGLDCRLPILQP